MRVLAYVHTFNDGEFIDQVLDAIRRQTRPTDAIIIVDNASTDGIRDRTFPDGVTVVRNSTNLGTSGAVRIGFANALEQGFDWTWILDPDSVPEFDALENLLGFFERLPPSEQEQVCFLACRLATGSGESEHRPMILTESTKFTPVEGEAGYTMCDSFVWSGCLFRMQAVEKIGLPSPDYFTDLSELEYGYRARQLGFTSYIVNSGVLHQDVGRPPGATARTWRFGPLSFPFFETSPLRSYYFSRNMLYFGLYQFRPCRPRWIFRSIVQALIFTTGFALRPVSRHRHLIACMRGLWDGLTGHIERRY
jgi:GT2 family glycosyltransferase